jgi:hypothetical protein
MQADGDAEAPPLRPDAEGDRSLQVLMLEYGTLRAEILTRLSARYQFIGFITAAAALIGVAIGYSSGMKVWLLTAVSAAVLTVGFYGYSRMVLRGTLISARVAEIENRINKLVPTEPGTPDLLGWESEHQHEQLFTALSDYRQLKFRMRSVQDSRGEQPPVIGCKDGHPAPPAPTGRARPDLAPSRLPPAR